MKRIIPIILFLSLVFACSSSDDSNDDNNETFDQGALLENLADNIILPAFQDFQSKLSQLDVARGVFVNNRTQSNLDNLSGVWFEAYRSWQNVEMFNVGEAEIQGGNVRGFVSFFNIYPVNVADVETAVETGVYDLNFANYHDAQGFPALDFLIHGVATGDNLPLDKFISNDQFEGYIEYLTNVISQMMTKNNDIVNSWEGTYRNTFVSNIGSSATSSFSKIVNDYIYYYEKGLRAAKIGIPAGNFSNEPLPEKVEAYYKLNISRDLALEGLDAVINFFEGSNGVGFADYLDGLKRTDLKNQIFNQFSEARFKLSQLDKNLYQQVLDDNTKMTEAYDALQAAVVLLKVDMVSAFSVTIDYIDADGD